MNTHSRIFLLIPFLLSSLLFAQPSGYTSLTDAGSFRQKLEQTSKKTHTIDSDFVQEKKLSFLNNKIESKGHFSFKKENLLRWEYNEPYAYLIIIDGEKILIDDENEQNEFDMRSNKLFEEINRVMLGTVQGTIFQGNDFEASYFESNENYLVQAKPKLKGMQEALSQIDIYFDKTNLMVAEVKLIEKSGDYTSIKFFNKRLNVPIADEKFRLD